EKHPPTKKRGFCFLGPGDHIFVFCFFKPRHFFFRLRWKIIVFWWEQGEIGEWRRRFLFFSLLEKRVLITETSN
ncbi:MAG: hypothetical protein ACTHLD_00285, partial [Chitinophaga sp.]